ncbi:hypothetical protein SRCM100623_00969 [Acetobacter pasteurianus]|uniref:KilA-N domain-containing protein n=1 Tax=Acetobacter pasteurianus TaxID=438 RepID=A0A1A0DBM3_ACEPA|nr:KilA-N domain-containing protein [Acetobacter pasteurianus]OAZ72430.1 hypothetical protein SRCM100623_00969 [Acetobacter pasteurianus]
MSTNNTELTILSTTIRRDADGRYCLNDCWRASGAENSKRPSLWEANAQTEALIEELKGSAGIPAHPTKTVKTGANDRRGTYACKELVYAYAMWISPKFHLQVIRAFDALVTGQIASQHNSVTVADMEKQVRSAVGGIVKGVVNKALEAQNTHMRLLEAKLDQALILLDRPAPNPNTIVAQHKVQRQEEGDDILVVKALQQLGGKATPRTIMRRLGTARWNASRRDAALASLIESGHVVIEQALTKPSPGRPTMDMVRLVQAPFHQTPA